MRRTVISDSTKITLTVVIALIGGSGFVTNVAFQTNSNAASIEKMREKNTRSAEKLDQIAIDIAVIKNKVETIEKKLDNKRVR